MPNNSGCVSKLPDILENKQRFIDMAREGAGKCEIYIAMGITRGCASRWSDENDDRFKPEFVEFMEELTTYSQAFWEKLGLANLWEKDFNASLYNKQMSGRFRADWGKHVVSENIHTYKKMDNIILNSENDSLIFKIGKEC